MEALVDLILREAVGEKNIDNLPYAADWLNDVHDCCDEGVCEDDDEQIVCIHVKPGPRHEVECLPKEGVFVEIGSVLQEDGEDERNEGGEHEVRDEDAIDGRDVFFRGSLLLSERREEACGEVDDGGENDIHSRDGEGDETVGLALLEDIETEFDDDTGGNENLEERERRRERGRRKKKKKGGIKREIED